MPFNAFKRFGAGIFPCFQVVSSNGIALLPSLSPHADAFGAGRNPDAEGGHELDEEEEEDEEDMDEEEAEDEEADENSENIPPDGKVRK